MNIPDFPMGWARNRFIEDDETIRRALARPKSYIALSHRKNGLAEHGMIVIYAQET